MKDGYPRERRGTITKGNVMTQEKLNNHFLLLQINDSQFPIGAYSHSYGLETYIQKGIVKDMATADNYIRRRLKLNFMYGDLLAARLSYEAADEASADKLDALVEIMEASRIPKETREASKRLGSRFVKTLEKMDMPWKDGFAKDYLLERKKGLICQPCAYGIVCAGCGIDKKAAMENFIYAQCSAMVTNCVKLVPLSQTDGQRMLSSMYTLFEEIVEAVDEAPEEMLCASTPAFDLRSIQHETLYSRLYMS